jgi:hypothetical protein
MVQLGSVKVGAVKIELEGTMVRLEEAKEQAAIWAARIEVLEFVGLGLRGRLAELGSPDLSYEKPLGS